MAYSQYLFKKGIGREDEIFGEVIKKLPDCYMIVGTSIDAIRRSEIISFLIRLFNYVVNIGISTDLNMHICTTHGMKETSKLFMKSTIKLRYQNC